MKTTQNHKNHVKMLQFSGFGTDSNIFHFITTRHGGVSQGNYSSFNLSEYSGDDPESVQQNRIILCNALEIPHTHLLVPYQVHGHRTAIIDESYFTFSKKEQKDLLYEVDSLITNQPGIAIAVTTADCVPVLLYAPDKKIVSAIHAGWRGTLEKIVFHTARCLVQRFGCAPEKIQAAIGPSICQDAFEVGDEVIDTFKKEGFNIDKFSVRSRPTGKAHINLWGLNQQQLIDVGLHPENIEVANLCTYTQPEEFFSARRLGIQSGRFLTGIMIKNSPFR